MSYIFYIINEVMFVMEKLRQCLISKNRIKNENNEMLKNYYTPKI